MRIFSGRRRAPYLGPYPLERLGPAHGNPRNQALAILHRLVHRAAPCGSALLTGRNPLRIRWMRSCCSSIVYATVRFPDAQHRFPSTRWSERTSEVRRVFHGRGHGRNMRNRRIRLATVPIAPPRACGCAGPGTGRFRRARRLTPRAEPGATRAHRAQKRFSRVDSTPLGIGVVDRLSPRSSAERAWGRLARGDAGATRSRARRRNGHRSRAIVRSLGYERVLTQLRLRTWISTL